MNIRFKITRLRQIILLKFGYTLELLKIGRDVCGCEWKTRERVRKHDKRNPIGIDDDGCVVHVMHCGACGLPSYVEKFENPQIAPFPLPSISGFRRRHFEAMKQERRTP